MPRFYYPKKIDDVELLLPKELAHHIRVIRLPENAEITLFDGFGGEYNAEIKKNEQKQLIAIVKKFILKEIELPYQLSLVQALPEGSKMDWIVEKAVELGAHSVQPISTQRSVVKLSDERMGKRLSHWQNIAIAASEQCGRNTLMQIKSVTPFLSWITGQTDKTRLLFTPRATQTLSEWTKNNPPRNMEIIIGAEGGLSPEEEKAAINQGAIPLTIGKRILRTETAGLAVLAMIQAIWEN